MCFGGNRRWVPLIGAVSRTFNKIQTVGNAWVKHKNNRSKTLKYNKV